jgi:hypothetical protein
MSSVYATHTARVLPLWLAGEQGFYLKNGIDIDPFLFVALRRWSPVLPPAASL